MVNLSSPFNSLWRSHSARLKKCWWMTFLNFCRRSISRFRGMTFSLRDEPTSRRETEPKKNQEFHESMSDIRNFSFQIWLIGRSLWYLLGRWPPHSVTILKTSLWKSICTEQVKKDETKNGNIGRVTARRTNLSLIVVTHLWSDTYRKASRLNETENGSSPKS